MSIIQALNLVYEEKEKRSFIWYQAVALTITLAAILFAIVALTLVAAVPAIVDFPNRSKFWA